MFLKTIHLVVNRAEKKRRKGVREREREREREKRKENPNLR